MKGTMHLVAFGLFATFVESAVAQDFDWIRQFGAPPWSSAVPVVTHATGIYVAGSTGGAFPGETNLSGTDAFLRKYDRAGNVVWTRQFGNERNQVPLGLAVDASGVYVGGGTTGALPGQSSAGSFDAFVRKYDFDGHEVWTRQFGSAAADFIVKMAGHASGVYVVGYTEGTLPGQTSAGARDGFVARFDKDGTLRWLRQFGTAGIDLTGRNAGIAVDDMGVYVAGTFARTLPGVADDDSADAFLRRYDFDGNEIWTLSFGTACFDAAFGVAAHPTGIYVTGNTLGDFDTPAECRPPGASAHNNLAYVRKFDRTGNVIWTRQYRGDDNVPEVIAADDSGVYVGGFESGVLPGEQAGGPESGQARCARVDSLDAADAYVRKFDFDGNVVWTRQFGSVRLDVVHGIAADATGIYAAGFTYCVLPGQTRIGDDSDAFLVKLTAAPTAPQGSIRLIVGHVETLTSAGTLNDGSGNALIASLAAAIAQLDAGKNTPAKNQLEAFVGKVLALRASGELSAPQAQALSDAATAALVQL